MNWRRIVAVILGIAALLSILSQLGVFRLTGLAEYPFWLIWPLTIAGMVGAIMLWFLGARNGEDSHSGSTAVASGLAGAGAGAAAAVAASGPDLSGELADRDARIASLEARLAEAQMASQDTGVSADVDAELSGLRGRQADFDAREGEVMELRNENSALKAEVSGLKDEIGETAQTIHATERVEFRGKSQDDLDAMFGGNFIDGALARHFQIDYVDSKGQPSEREILVYALVHRKGNLNLDSFPSDGYSCLTFRADRIQKLKDLQTGDVVSEDIGDWIVKTSKERAAN